MSMEMISKLIRKVPGSKLRALIADARKAQQGGQWDVAVQKYTEALPLARDKFGLLVQLGHMQKELGNYSDAEKSYSAALTMRPEDWDLHVQFGHLFNRQGAPDKALIWYEKALALRHDDAAIKALVENTSSRAQAPDIENLRHHALSEMDTRQFQEALPKVELLFYTYSLRDFDVILGHAYRELGHYSQAEEAYRAYRDRCLQQNSPHIFDAYFQLGNVAKLTGQTARALNYYIEAKFMKNRTDKFLDGSDPIIREINFCIERLYPVFFRH